MLSLLFFLLQVSFYPWQAAQVVELVVLVLLLLLSAFISGSESAFFSLRPVEREQFNSEVESSTSSRFASRLLAQQDRLLATILFMNNFVNVGIVILSVFITNAVVSFGDSEVAGFLVKGVLITFVLLLFGEILPKILASTFPVPYVRFASLPLYGMNYLLKPFSMLMANAVRRVNLRFTPKQGISIDELGEALAITGGQRPEQESILRRIVHFGHIEACEIMRPRIDVAAIDVEGSYAELRELVLSSGYSRIPVYEDSFDRIVGVLYVKDLIPHIDEDEGFNWVSLIRKPYFVPENKKIDDLFAEFQRNRIHFAIVVDEYGGTCGVITLEDILEEIFGEIEDESDGQEQYYVKVSEGVFLFEGKILLNDFCKIMESDETALDSLRGDAETLAGLLLEVLGRFPEVGEVVHVGSLQLTVEGVTSRRIEKVRVEVQRVG